MSIETQNNPIPVRLSEETRRKVAEMAEKEMRSLSNTLNFLVIKGLESLEQTK